MAKSPEQQLAEMVAALKETTGKTMEEWAKVVASFGDAKHMEAVKRLKEEHGIGHGYANAIVHMARQSSSASAEGDDLVAAQYAGAKAALRPLYDALAAEIAAFGNDVEFSPKKAYVSLRRSKQFAILQPSTATRLDVGINLKGVEPTARLEASGSFNAMVTHRVRVASAADIDAELIGWLRKAYEGA